MSGTNDAQRYFDAGVLSLGVPIDGRETDRDLQYAAMAFRHATECYPNMSDAWLGRAAAGEITELTEAAYDELVCACTTLYEGEVLDSAGKFRRNIDLAGNGRSVRNVIEAAEAEREYRLSESCGAGLEGLDEEQLMRIDLSDMKSALGGVVGTLNPGS